MKLTAPQQKVSDSKKRFITVCAGRRAGKTFLAINELAKFARFPKQRVAYMAPTYKQAKQVVFNDLLDQLYSKNWIEKVNQSELSIKLVNGSMIYLLSLDNYETIRGRKFNFVVIDEAATVDPAAWFTVVRPCLSDTNGHALIIGTPKGRNWFYSIFTKDDPEWESFSFTTADGGNVSKEELEQAKNDLDERTYQQEYEAAFITYSGITYFAFDPEIHMKPAPPIEHLTPLHVGMDFNVDPMSAVVGVYRNDQLHIIDEIEIYGSDTQEMCTELRTRYPHNSLTVYPDASGGKRSTASGNLSDHVILNNNGFKVITGKTNPAVMDRIASVNAMFKNKNGQSRLYIDPKCRKLRECLLKMSYKPDSRIPDKSSGFDHMTDSLGYAVMGLAPIHRQSNTVYSKTRRM